MIKNLAI